MNHRFLLYSITPNCVILVIGKQREKTVLIKILQGDQDYKMLSQNHQEFTPILPNARISQLAFQSSASHNISYFLKLQWQCGSPQTEAILVWTWIDKKMLRSSLQLYCVLTWSIVSTYICDLIDYVYKIRLF